MVTILMISEKIATLGLPKIKVYWNKWFDVIVSANDVTNRFLLREADYVVNVVVSPKFGNFTIYMKEVIMNSRIIRTWPEKPIFFEEWSWFKFNNLELTLVITLKF